MKGDRGPGKPKASVKPNGRPRGRVERAGQGRESRSKRAARGNFPIVGIGASAGGLEAFTKLLEHLPADTGMAFVLVQHLLPKHESALTELLAKRTSMPVTEVKEGMTVERDRVYVIPPDKKMALSNRVLHLVPRDATTRPIDFFLESLARTQQSRAIGVILSGTATDGTLGLCAIKAEGGITFAQDEESAKYDSMPRSAIASGSVDFVLPPEKIAEELARIGPHPYVNHATAQKGEGVACEDPAGEKPPEGGATAALRKVFSLLRSKTGADFTHYKHATIMRRIRRRMFLKKADTLDGYVQFLERNPAECAALYDDILIHVTGFFRDPKAFEVLKRKVLPALLKGRDRDVPIRVWVPGCSTGEEAYSLAITLLEHLGEKAPQTLIQVFATDLSEKAISQAREGVYPADIASRLSESRLRRFFTKTEHGYRIGESVRKWVVFARHDVTKDPPYSRLDIVSCRNLLIFLEPLLQRRVFAALHWALKSDGYLMLGSAETVGELSDYFHVVDSKQKIYSKKSSSVPLQSDFFSRQGLMPEEAAPLPRHPMVGVLDVQREADRLVLEEYGPPGIVVDEDMEIVQFRGHAGPYLDPMPGTATLKLLKVARGEMLFDLRAATHRAKKTNAPVRRDGIKVDVEGNTRTINLHVLPIGGQPGGKRHFLVLFQEVPSARTSARKAAEAGPQRAKGEVETDRTRRLEQELKAAKSYLRSAVEDQEAFNEELRTANEEILAANEELQTTNEELETAKEELQSTNEELTTLNEELQNRNQELAQAASDLRNVLSSTFTGIVLVGRDLRIRFFTPEAEKVLNLIPTDVGRPIRDIRPALQVPDLEQMVEEAVDNVQTKEIEAQGPEGHYYSLRVRPYMTPEKKIDGAVVALMDVTERKLAEQALANSEEHFRSLVEGIRDYAIMLLDNDGYVVNANSGAEEVLGYRWDEIQGKHVSCYFPGQNREAAEQELATVRTSGRFETEAPRVRKDGSEFWANVVTIALRDTSGKIRGFAEVVRNISARKQAEDLSRQLSIRMMQAQDEERRRISRELHDSAGPSLAALVMNLARVEKAASGLNKTVRGALSESLKLAKECSQQLRTMSYELHPPLLEEAGLASALRWYLEGFAKRGEVKTELEIPPDLGRLPKEVEFTIFRVVQAAVSNVHRHSGSPTAKVRIVSDTDRVIVEVKDEGKGMPAKVAEGLGIRGMRERVGQLGGNFEIVGNREGTTVRASMPAAGSLAGLQVVRAVGGGVPENRERRRSTR